MSYLICKVITINCCFKIRFRSLSYSFAWTCFIPAVFSRQITVNNFFLPVFSVSIVCYIIFQTRNITPSDYVCPCCVSKLS